MKKLVIVSMAAVLAGWIAFWVGQATAPYSPASAQIRGIVFPKVEIRVAIEGIRETFSAGVKGIGAEAEIEEIRDPETGLIRKIPGRLKWGDITLKRGVISTDGEDAFEQMHKWYADIKRARRPEEVLGKRKNGAIILLAEDGTEIAKYEFFEAWPCKWKGFSAPDASAVNAVEGFELIIHKVRRSF